MPPPSSIPPAAQRQIDALPPDQRALAERAYPKNDGHIDAFRHAYWNARLTSEFGAADPAPAPGVIGTPQGDARANGS